MNRRATDLIFRGRGEMGVHAVFIDPGLCGTGLAVFRSLHYGEVSYPSIVTAIHQPTRSRRLPAIHWQVGVDLISTKLRHFEWGEEWPDVAVMEYPELWASSKSHASATHSARRNEPGDLFKLTYLMGHLGSVFSVARVPVVLVSPQDWKGQITKPMVLRRVLNMLPGLETRLCRKLRDHETDAVGMGLSAVGEL